MHFTGPKAKKCRRQGVNLFGSEKYDKILQKKPNLPGKNPKDRRGKMSEYGQQLLEKQKVRDMYGLTEKQLSRVYREASQRSSKTDLGMRVMLERRLDNALYRAGFALTRPQARQFISHGLFAVNGHRVTIASYQLSEGDKVEARPRSKSSPVFEGVISAHERYTPPTWLKADASALSFQMVSEPQEDHLEQAVDMRKVVEFYSR